MPKLCAGGDLPSEHQPFGKAMVCGGEGSLGISPMSIDNSYT